MNDRCISTSMPTGSTRSCAGTSTTERQPLSDVQETNVLGVAHDEAAPRLDVLAHEHAEQLVRGSRVVERDLEQDALGRVHGGVPQLPGVHLAEALEALDPVVLVDLL